MLHVHIHAWKKVFWERVKIKYQYVQGKGKIQLQQKHDDMKTVLNFRCDIACKTQTVLAIYFH